MTARDPIRKKNIKGNNWLYVKYLFLFSFFFHNEFQTKLNSGDVINRDCSSTVEAREIGSLHIFLKKMLSYFLFL